MYKLCAICVTALFSFLDTDFILQSEIKRGTMNKVYDKVLRSVLLSSRRDTELQLGVFPFSYYVLLSKNSWGLHPKAPFKICAVRFTLARGVGNLLNLCNELFPTESLIATQT